MDYSNLTNVVTYVSFIVILKFLGCVGEPSSPLQLQLLNRTSTQAFIQWSGNGTCKVTQKGIHPQNQSREYPIELNIKPPYILNELVAADEYSIIVECTDVNGAVHRSPEFIIPAATAVTASTPGTPQSLPKHPHPLSDGALHPTYPDVMEEEETKASPEDLALGVCLGLLGAAIIIAVIYHVAKRYRRNLRIRRLLQYRQQDSDPFADMDPDSEQ